MVNLLLKEIMFELAVAYRNHKKAICKNSNF